MLARSGRLPTSGDFSYEVKWDGFRAAIGERGVKLPPEDCFAVDVAFPTPVPRGPQVDS